MFAEPIPEVEHESQLHKTETKVAKVTAATRKDTHVTEPSNKLPTLPESSAIATEHNTDIEKSAKDNSNIKPSKNKEASSSNKAQLKLSQSLESPTSDSIEQKMKDINLNNEVAGTLLYFNY